jgi:hypothetical protein
MPFEPTLRRLVNVLVAGLIATRDG